MAKISAGAIIARSYRFAFGDFFGILGIIWLPLAIELVLAYLVLMPYLAAITDLISHLPKAGGDEQDFQTAFSQSMSVVYRYVIIFAIVAMFLRAQMMLGIMRRALGLGGVPRFVFFALGKDVWRLFGAYFVYYVLIQIAVFAVLFVVVIPAMIVVYLAAMILNAAQVHGEALKVIAGVGIVAGVVLLYGAIFYIVLRLTFLVTPVVVVEKSIHVARIWNLAKGNVWRIFLICLAIMIPVMIVYAFLLFAVVFSLHWPVLLPVPHGSPEATAAAIDARIVLMFTTLRNAWPFFLPIVGIFATIFYGLTGGAMAFVYRALVPPPQPKDEAPVLQAA